MSTYLLRGSHEFDSCENQNYLYFGCCRSGKRENVTTVVRKIEPLVD